VITTSALAVNVTPQKKCYECDKDDCQDYSKKVCTVKTIDEWRKDVLIEETRAHKAKVARERVETEKETAMLFG
jgi:hypothetical protein